MSAVARAEEVGKMKADNSAKSFISRDESDRCIGSHLKAALREVSAHISCVRNTLVTR